MAYRFSLVSEQHFARILGPRCQQQDSLPSLRKPECPRVNDAVHPVVSQGVKSIGDVPHRGTAAELQHERDVFQQKPPRATLALNQTEDMAHQSGLVAVHSLSSAGVRKVLAWEACCD
jgi:hypothetical protein